MKKFLPRIFIYFSAFFLGVLYALHANVSIAASATHVVISEVQTAGVTSFDEFIELYNPTSSDVTLSNWRITKKTAGGVESPIASSLSGTIASHGYFLLAPIPGYTGAAAPDQSYATSSASISSDNTVLLYDAGSNVIDKVGFGGALDFEGATETNPAANTSRERRANSTATSATMIGIDALLGNGEDTDNNANDFVLRSIPEPQNSLSFHEPADTPTPTSVPTNTPTPTPTSTPTPVPTNTPTPTPTVTPSPTPTDTPTPTPTSTIIPTETPTPTPTPTLAPTNTPTPTPVPAGSHLSCGFKSVHIKILHHDFHIPCPVCEIQKEKEHHDRDDRKERHKKENKRSSD